MANYRDSPAGNEKLVPDAVAIFDYIEKDVNVDSLRAKLTSLGHLEQMSSSTLQDNEIIYILTHPNQFLDVIPSSFTPPQAPSSELTAIHHPVSRYCPLLCAV